jgi:hypothetical protein
MSISKVHFPAAVLAALIVSVILALSAFVESLVVITRSPLRKG